MLKSLHALNCLRLLLLLELLSMELLISNHLHLQLLRSRNCRCG